MSEVNWREVSRRDLLKIASAGAATVGAGGLLAACGGDSSPSKTTGATLEPGAGRPGGRFRIAATGAPPGPLDGQTLGGGDTLTRYVVYDQLTAAGSDASAVPLLAESWEPNKDATAWTIHLREGVEFHNGKTMTADDVIFSLRRVMDPKTGAAGFSSLSTVDGNGLKKLDKYTVLVPLTTANAVLPELTLDAFVNIVPVGYDPAKPVGTGPYKLVKHTAGQSDELARHENYWGAPGKFDEVEVLYIDDQTARLNALLSGQVDGVAQLAPSQVEQVKSASGLKLLSGPGGGFTPFQFLVSGAFKDDRVRQAMRLLVDRQQMIDVAMAGQAELAYDNYGVGDPGFDPEMTRERDVEQAKSLLKQAGQSDLAFEITFTAAYAGMVEGSQVLVQNCADAGVDAKAHQVDVGTFYSRQFWPVNMNFWTGLPILTLASLALAKGAAYNRTKWVDPGYNASYQAALKELDEGKRTQHKRDMQRALFDRGPWMIPYFTNNLGATTSKVAGFDPADLPGSNFMGRQIGLASFV